MWEILVSTNDLTANVWWCSYIRSIKMEIPVWRIINAAISRKIRIPDDRNTPAEAGINTSVKPNTTQHQQAK